MIFATVLYGLVLLALAVVLAQCFRSTRNVGYIVLGIALPLWPVASWPLNAFRSAQVDRYAEGEGAAFPLSLFAETAGSMWAMMSYLQGALQMLLVLVGFILLTRPGATVGSAPPNSALQPTAPSLRDGRDG